MSKGKPRKVEISGYDAVRASSPGEVIVAVTRFEIWKPKDLAGCDPATSMAVELGHYVHSKGGKAASRISQGDELDGFVAGERKAPRPKPKTGGL